MEPAFPNNAAVMLQLQHEARQHDLSSTRKEQIFLEFWKHYIFEVMSYVAHAGLKHRRDGHPGQSLRYTVGGRLSMPRLRPFSRAVVLYQDPWQVVINVLAKSKGQCVACDDDIDPIQRGTYIMSHREGFSCASCARRTFTLACQRELDFHQLITRKFDLKPDSRFRSVLGEDLWKLVRQKSEEFATAVGNRIYCHKCSKFIPPSAIVNNVGECITCHCQTCALCKKQSHENECDVQSDDEAMADLHGLADEQDFCECFDRGDWDEAMIEQESDEEMADTDDGGNPEKDQTTDKAEPTIFLPSYDMFRSHDLALVLPEWARQLDRFKQDIATVTTREEVCHHTGGGVVYNDPRSTWDATCMFCGSRELNKAARCDTCGLTLCFKCSKT